MKKFHILILFSILTSCGSDITFDSGKWKEVTDVENYPYRELMLKDIIENRRLVGLSYSSVVDSLGESRKYTDIKKNELWYVVTVDFGTDIDPIYTKHLTLTLDKDSTVEKVEIKEWKK